jgi:nucleotide-binding universal stress UspA family protein
MHRAYIEKIAEVMRLHLIEAQEITGIKSGDKVVKVLSDLAVGYPAEEILSYAVENEVDFILIASHGNSGIKRWAISSVTDKILRASEVPVFLVRSEITYDTEYDKWPQRQLVVPLDGSKQAESVLPYVELLAKQQGEGVEVVLLMVCHIPDVASDYPQASLQHGWQEYINQVYSSIMKADEQYLVKIEKQLQDAGLKVKSQVIRGIPAQKIIEFSHKNPFSLVIIVDKGSTWYDNCAYSDVVDKVLHRGTNPIFLVRTAKCKTS